jgi:hypothetical protein
MTPHDKSGAEMMDDRRIWLEIEGLVRRKQELEAEVDRLLLERDKLLAALTYIEERAGAAIAKAEGGE